MTVPCFFVSLTNFIQKHINGKRYFREQRFLISFVPGTVNKNSQICDVVDRLNDTLEFISLDTELLKGSNMSCEVIEGTLRFYVNYNFYAYKQTALEEQMESLTVESGLKK